MNAEAGTEQKMRKGQERDRSGASALDVHPDGHNVKRIGKSRLSRSIGIALAACILVSSPAQAAKTPLISGTESDSDSEADGPALEDGTITENSADNTIASQSGSYTEEQLADSMIEYGELEALVRRGNGTAVSADYSYQDSLAVYQEAYDAMISGARDMNYKADELEDAGGDEALIGTYERNAQTLSMAAKQYKKSLTSLNSASSRASRNRTVWQVVKTAQIQWGTCRQLQDEVGAAAKTAENYQAQVDRKERELAAGLCTETDLLQAQKNLLSAQTALQSTTAQANKALRQLAILLGKSGTSITLGEIPAVSATELASMNLDADRAAAVVASSSVKSARRSSATGDAARKLRHQQIEEAESAASASADEQYAEIAALSLERDAALADSVPGVSGGTIAFILGFYDRFLDSLHALFGKDRTARKDALCYLAKLGTGWSIGMIACVLVLSGLIEKNIYFMSSLFLGLTLASLPFIILAERPVLKNLRATPFALLGAAVVVGLTLLRSGTSALGSVHFSSLLPLSLLYIFLSGTVAITAMVLPGISGSSILLIAGVYLPTVQAIKAFLSLDFSVVPGLCALGFGVIAGVGLSVHGIRTALRKYRSQMVWLILGLMLGSTYAIANGPASLSSPLPPLDITSFHVPAFLLGVAILLGLEFSKKFMQQNEKPSPAAQKGESLS